MSFLTGSSKKGQKYSLMGYNYLANSPEARGYISTGYNANNAIASLLGVGGGSRGGGMGGSPSSMTNAGRGSSGMFIPAAQGGGGEEMDPQDSFKNYLNSTGYQFRLNEGNRAITSNAAASGLLNSGATLKASQEYGQNLASSEFSNYLSQLGGLSQAGQGMLSQTGQAATAGGANAAQYTGDGGSGAFGSIVGAAMMMFSDERLKDDMTHKLTDKHGIRYYTWKWNDKAKSEFGLPEGEQFGVSAQELEDTEWKRAVSRRDGYRAVNYYLLPKLDEAA